MWLHVYNGPPNVPKFLKIYSLDYNLTCIDSYKPTLINEGRLIPIQASLANGGNSLSKILNIVILRLGSPKSAKSTNIIKLEKSLEQVKSEEEEGSMTAPKPRYSRVNTHLRKDVVNKTIIRALSRFYIKHFKLNQNFNGNANEFVESIAHQQARNLINSSISYQEYFSLASEEGSESKVYHIVIFAI